MKQEIRFKGLSLDRDELAAQHGELALCGGLELHEGALRPSILNGTSLGGGNALTGTLVYVHIVNGTKYYITFANAGLYYAKESNGTWDQHQITGLNYLNQNGLSVTSVGNTLCVFANSSQAAYKGLHYILFKDGSYRYLGRKPPFLELQFNMYRNTTQTDIHTAITVDVSDGTRTSGGGFISDEDGGDLINYDTSQTGTGGWDIRDAYRTAITEQVMAAVNKLTHDVVDKGFFHMPFLIRYCYRMYDGTSLIMHSPVVLLMPYNSIEAVAGVKKFVKYKDGGFKFRNYDKSFNCSITILAAKLQVRCINTSSISTLQDWGDIIKSLDIFITPQISRLDSSKQIAFINNMWVGSLAYGFLNGSRDRYTAPDETETGDGVYTMGELRLPICSDTEYKEKIRKASTFFKIASFKVSDLNNKLSSSFSDLTLEENVAGNIEVQQQMTDDYKTHNLLVPISNEGGGLYTYNHRLNVYGFSEELFNGFKPQVLFPYINSSNTINKVIVTLSTEDGTKRVEMPCSGAPFDQYAAQYYVFFPDSRADTISFQYGQTESDSYKFKLDEHPFLNGAINVIRTASGFQLPQTSNQTVPLPNKIYTSKADNPFYFPNLVGESGINDVGSGRIVGMGALTRALSQGQVGDHSLAVFCTDGIWVLKVSDTGTYSAKHNISNEVCVNPKSICQLGQSIMFASERSLNRFYESDVIPVSDALNGPIKSIQAMLPTFYAAFNTGGAYANADMKKLLDFGVPAINYFRDGKVFYDYELKRLLVIPGTLSASTTNVVLVFSIEDQAWSTMVIPATRTILQGYPNLYIQDSSGGLKVLDAPYPQQEQSPTASPGIIITRTLVFSETMDVIQGFQQLCDCANMPQLYLYGSNDQRTWTFIGNSGRAYANYLPGHPFRYFRVAMYFSMTKTERYQELILDVKNKYAKL